MGRSALLNELLEAKITAVVRTKTAEQAVQTARALYAAGIRLVEITFTVPDAATVIGMVAAEKPANCLVGAGTVTTAEQARAALAAGAQFIVGPVHRPALVALAHEADVPCIMAGLTPTEILDVYESGSDMVKVFPIDSVGGPGYVKSVLGPLPGIPIVASGGIGYDNYRAYLAAGAVGVALGSGLMPTALIAAGDYAGLTDFSRRFVEELALA
jgi:2-dehydro-3-deoxyphosphogluconate aldolase/(4S)-4-hydroxy-2-oxoglutarate aldolase